ncbi:MIP/aquaporin family protein [Nostoc sp. TCL26-01]|uniref:MIP/aquaporin family protein n=1 Tax=Nostoc sp. TCL26-01 TaxID=2576904 RepID=UPI0015B82BB0|nr:aquaporin [Nostoc sp. TCL26-01]QLE54676.1 aquaporin family protein [Nostoc sp. TCL26-01]
MQSLRKHYAEYLMEAGELGIFMIAAAVVTAIFEHPSSLVRQTISEPVLRRFFIGLAMGLTAIGIIYSPWGKQSGAHINPVVTLTFFRLGKIEFWDAVFYVLAQFVGGLLGLLLAVRILRGAIAHPTVNYIVTIPGTNGVIGAFLAELLISFGVMLMILVVSNHPKLAPLTGICAGVLITIYITVEAPLSGMSMNPTRTLASAIPSHNWTAIWVYFTAPLLGMLSAAEVYVRLKGKRAVRCAKLHHHNNKRCIFRCGYSHPEADYRSLLSDKLPNS